MQFGELPDDVPQEIREKVKHFHDNILDPMLRRVLSKFFKHTGTNVAKVREMIENDDLTGQVDFLNRSYTGEEILKVRDELYGLAYAAVINFGTLQASNLISAIFKGEEIDSVDSETGQISYKKIEGMENFQPPSEEGDEWKSGKKSDDPPESKRSRFKGN